MTSIYGLIYIALFGILFLLPFINNEGLINSIIVSKTFFFISGLLLVFGMLIAKFFFAEKLNVKLKTSRVDILLVLLFSFIIINKYFIQPQNGFSIRFIELMGLGFFYFFLRILPSKSYLWLSLAIMSSGILQAAYGALQLTGYFPSLNPNFNVTGSFFNPGPYAGFLAIVGNVALGTFLFKKDILIQIASDQKKQPNIKCKLINNLFQYIPIIGIITIVIILPATHSRAAWLAFLFGAVIMLSFKYGVVNRFYNWNRFKRIVIALTTFIILSTSFYGVYHFKRESADGRMLIWKITSHIIKNNPILGVGHDRFKAYYMNAQANYFNTNPESAETLVADNSYYAFNAIIQFVSENGLLGFSLAIAIVFFYLRIKTTRESTFLKPFSIGILFSVIVFGMFSYPMQILPVKAIWVFALVMLANIDKKTTSLNFFKSKDIVNNKSKWLLKISVLFIGSITIWTVNTKIDTTENGFKGWKTAMYAYNYGAYDDSIESFEKVHPILERDGNFLMNYGKVLSMSGQHIRAIEILELAKRYLNTTIIETALGNSYQALKQYEKAENAYQTAANMIPSRFYPHYLLAKLYDESGENYKAKIKAQELLQKEVKIPSPAIKEMLTEMEKMIEKYNIKKTSGL